jgi:hypothetical protein
VVQQVSFVETTGVPVREREKSSFASSSHWNEGFYLIKFRFPPYTPPFTIDLSEIERK